MEGHSSSKLDEEFVKLIVSSIQTMIEASYVDFNKHEKIRVEQWVRSP